MGKITKQGPNLNKSNVEYYIKQNEMMLTEQ